MRPKKRAADRIDRQLAGARRRSGARELCPRVVASRFRPDPTRPGRHDRLEQSFASSSSSPRCCALATAFAACGGGGGSDDPQAVVDEATLKGIESGDIDLSLAIDVEGEKGGNVDVNLSGPFQSEERRAACPSST